MAPDTARTLFELTSALIVTIAASLACPVPYLPFFVWIPPFLALWAVVIALTEICVAFRAVLREHSCCHPVEAR